METKDYLAQLYYLDKIINSKIEEIGQLKDLATRVSPCISEDKVKGGKLESKMEIYICKWVDLENEIKEDINNLLDLKKEIKSVIERVSDPKHKLILSLRYLNCKKWEEISEELNYTYRQLARIHCNAIKAVDLERA